ncbi:MAG: hypothetical protein E7Z89_07745 [Cyanobacteria bacterium SIG28]|nr:hypothetical protein [Cyanobacteria bacterium SIG28]
MSSQQDVIYGLMSELEDALDKGFPLLGYHFTVVKKDTVTSILDKLYAALPDEIKEARALLRRKDELQYEAQQRAEKIVADAQAEANRLLSESDLLRAVQREAEKIKEQVITDCEDIKRKSVEDAELVRNQALDEALRTKDGASVFAEQILVSLEQNLNNLQEIVKTGQLQLERKRTESDGQIAGNYTNQRAEFAQDFRMN